MQTGEGAGMLAEGKGEGEEEKENGVCILTCMLRFRASRVYVLYMCTDA